MSGFEIYIKLDRLSKVLGYTPCSKLENIHTQPKLMAKLKELRDDLNTLLSDELNQTTVQKSTGSHSATHLP